MNDVETLKEELVDRMVSTKSFGAYDKEKQVFVIGNPDDPENALLFQDVRVLATGKPIVLEELDCDTRFTVKVKRPKWIRARVRNADGEVNTVRYDGFTARFFQQMVDKLAGIDSRRKANRFHVEQAERKMKKNAR